MIKYSRVYRNQATVIPKEINVKTIEKENVIKWTINQKSQEISANFLSKRDMNKDNINKIIKTEEFVYIYRNISEKRHIVLPVEVEKILNFDYRRDLLKWTVKSDRIIIDKLPKADLMKISGILNK